MYVILMLQYLHNMWYSWYQIFTICDTYDTRSSWYVIYVLQDLHCMQYMFYKILTVCDTQATRSSMNMILVLQDHHCIWNLCYKIFIVCDTCVTRSSSHHKLPRIVDSQLQGQPDRVSITYSTSFSHTFLTFSKLSLRWPLSVNKAINPFLKA